MFPDPSLNPVLVIAAVLVRLCIILPLTENLERGFTWISVGNSYRKQSIKVRDCRGSRHCKIRQKPKFVELEDDSQWWPGLILNVEQNISYFGDGSNEAQMVYNFSLPPLTLHAFHKGNTTILSDWARGLKLPSDKVTFFNFMASHDGIGITPAKGLIPEDEINEIGERVSALGGRVSYKNNSDGTQSVYELNINYLNALGEPDVRESNRLKADRFLSSQAIMLALQGVPGIYFHSLFGSENWEAGAAETGQHRSINREKLRYVDVCADLNDIDSLRSQVFYRYRHMIAVRAAEPAFDPYGSQKIFQLHTSLFCVLRGEGEDAVFCIQNVTNKPIHIQLDPQEIFMTEANWYRNILNNEIFEHEVEVKPYGIMWLKLH